MKFFSTLGGQQKLRFFTTHVITVFKNSREIILIHYGKAIFFFIQITHVSPFPLGCMYEHLRRVKREVGRKGSVWGVFNKGLRASATFTYT